MLSAIATGKLVVVNSLAIFFLHHAVTRNAWSKWMLDLRPSMNMMLSTQLEGTENDGEVRFRLNWSFRTSN